ncbi:MAG: hypothetical protein NTU53_06855 [Planctomycetota bacterium]|nr:hypothetical protein [Planctomycetota bacterium]
MGKALKSQKKSAVRAVQIAPMSGARIREVFDSDLERLADRSDESTPSSAFAFAMAFLPLSIGLLVGFMTHDNPSPKAFAGYLAVIGITFIPGLFFLVLWFRTRENPQKKSTDLLRKIREMSPFISLQGVEETTTSDAASDTPDEATAMPSVRDTQV